jgi:hypothetical protein
MISQCSGGLFLLPPLDSALGERGHRCHFAWVPFSSVDAYPLGDCSFLLLLLSFATVLSSHCPDFPHASDLRLDLAWPWYYWSPLLCLHLFVGSIFFFPVFAFFSFSTIHTWDLQNWLPSLTVFSPDFLTGSGHRFYCASLPSLPFSPPSSISAQGGVALIGFTAPPFPLSPFPHRCQALHRAVWL